MRKLKIKKNSAVKATEQAEVYLETHLYHEEEANIPVSESYLQALQNAQVYNKPAPMKLKKKNPYNNLF